jgi:phosphohistidine phosphatase
MDLIIWRHAEAEDEKKGRDDLQRELTRRGEKQAARMAQWLDAYLPEDARILCSPALRCEQTVLPLGRPYELGEALAPGNPPEKLLEAVGWPDARRPVLVVGHQPMLGLAIARLVGFRSDNSPIRKGAVWWLRTRKRDGQQQTVILSVLSPDLL